VRVEALDEDLTAERRPPRGADTSAMPYALRHSVQQATLERSEPDDECRYGSCTSCQAMFKLLLIVTASGLLLAAGAVERFTATAVTVPKAGLRPVSVTIEIVIDRWSTDAERDRLIEAIEKKGSSAALDLIRSLPSIGHISTSTSSGTSLRFAHARPTSEGGRQIIIATERPMSVGEQRPRFGRSPDHPFSLVDIRIDKSGAGDGKLAYAAQLAHNRKTGAIEIENYATEPVHLTGVRSVSGR
jgi:hypothetical protein